MDNNKSSLKGYSSYHAKCNCENDNHIEDNMPFSHFPLAMSYVPMQPWEEPYDLQLGLKSGTIFPSLNLPFYGGGIG